MRMLGEQDKIVEDRNRIIGNSPAIFYQPQGGHCPPKMLIVTKDDKYNNSYLEIVDGSLQDTRSVNRIKPLF
jgi:hypothetical protein